MLALQTLEAEVGRSNQLDGAFDFPQVGSR
jgi:hypothetical protein